LLALLEQLHPSPAVGGLPRAAALAHIREQEGLDRGWYAGPVGWIDDRGEGEFAVALRSALLHEGCATLFAGCGIVDGSSPDDEYRETEVKMRTMASALSSRPSMSRRYG
ncbi:chorismate-binding protein, partial [Cutibacterium acnes]